MAFVGGQAPAYKEYVANLELKMRDPAFREDVAALLRSTIAFSPDDAYALIKKCLIDKMDGHR